MFGIFRKKVGAPEIKFNEEAVQSEPPANTTLKKQSWEIGYFNGTLPSLKVSLLGQTQYDYNKLVEALKDSKIPFIQRGRISTETPEEIIEVRGMTDFKTLSDILGTDIMNQAQHDLDIRNVEEINWQQGSKDNVLLTMHADVETAQNAEAVANTLGRLGISSRASSYDPSTIIVCGKDMKQLNNIVRLTGPVVEWIKAFDKPEFAPVTLDA